MDAIESDDENKVIPCSVGVEIKSNEKQKKRKNEEPIKCVLYTPHCDDSLELSPNPRKRKLSESCKEIAHLIMVELRSVESMSPEEFDDDVDNALSFIGSSLDSLKKQVQDRKKQIEEIEKEKSQEIEKILSRNVAKVLRCVTETCKNTNINSCIRYPTTCLDVHPLCTDCYVQQMTIVAGKFHVVCPKCKK